MIKYLNYKLFSTHGGGYGIHSPFVFNLITKVFRNKINPDMVNSIEKIRHKLILDHRTIKVTDFGSGPEKMCGNLRRIAEIARYSSIPGKYGVLLANMSSEFGKPHIVEFGTSLGISTMYIAAFCPEATVYTIEGCPEISGIAKKNFEEAGLKNIRIFTGTFEKVLPEIKKDVMNPGLVFIDGNHRKEPVIEYFNEMAEISDRGTVIMLDDIHYSREMGEAWEVIKQHRNVSTTIDLFRMGIVFFKKGLTHIDYIIRY